MTTKHDRDLDRAVARFEDGQEKLYRRDGFRFYGDEEHRERMSGLSSEFAQKVDAIISEAEEEAARHEEQGLALSYEDPTAGLSSTEHSRLAEARVFVQEDCAELSLAALLERMRAVSPGNDKPTKVLHARYAARRLEAEDARRDELARRGANDARPEAEREAYRRLRKLVEELEEEAADEDQRRRRESAPEKAEQSREAVARARRKRSEIDGTDARAREEQTPFVHGVVFPYPSPRSPWGCFDLAFCPGLMPL